jgi:hypothetical protein
MSKERYEVLKRNHKAQGDLAYCLAVFGDTLAKREKYKDIGLTGMDAVHFYLVQKFHWLPRDVKSMSAEDVRFVLSEEMASWTMPTSAR